MDFTVKKYTVLLDTLINQGYTFQTFDEFIDNPALKSIVLRHDVDLLPHNSLEFAKIQAKKGVKGTYYFRAVPQSWDEKIIKEISNLGHEIGYHYENLTTCRGNMEMGIEDFKINLSKLRKLAKVSTICMHGSPMSKFDSKDLWKKYDYKSFDIKGEPYFDVDFSNVFYLTDTGRKWDGDRVSVRDKVDSKFDISLHSTNQIISYTSQGRLPKRIMFTFHPQRWNDNYMMWIKELFLQSTKNLIKRMIYVKK
jgi:hypothetical protein